MSSVGPSGSGLILASKSKSRANLLKGAGLVFTCVPAAIDEEKIKEELPGKAASARDIALMLAKEKALDVSRTRDDFVLGADQILDLDGKMFNKPSDMKEAGDHIRALSGNAHTLQTAIVLSRGGDILWEFVSAPSLTMRAMDDIEIENYLSRAGEGVLSSVGAYQLEGVGVNLFERIDGDYFSILGLPLLETLAALRAHGVIEQGVIENGA